MTAHVHAWTPMSGWTARYRCNGCAAIGYRHRIVQGDARPKTSAALGADHIQPYLCDAAEHGTRCGRPAVAKDQKSSISPKHWRCPQHRLEVIGERGP